MDSANSYKVRAIASAIAALVCGGVWFFSAVGAVYPFWCLGGVLLFTLLTSSNYGIYERKR